jgi:ribonucleoside-diphosphate reductase alpha chain
MSARTRLPNRRACEHFGFQCNGLSYVASVGRFQDGRLAEIFIANSKAGSQSDSGAKDAAVVASIALQHGVPLDVIRHALLRDARGIASSPLGAALDLVADGGAP